MSTTHLWQHQQDAVEFARGRAATLLDCGMGTGKTLIALKLLEEWGAKRVLVLGPLAGCGVWGREAKKHGYAHDFVDLSAGTTKRRAKKLAQLASVREVMHVAINYQAFWRGDLWRALAQMEFDVVIADEAHRLKSPFGVASKKARSLRAKRRLALTGTPMPHSPMDAWALGAWLDKRVLGDSFTLFRATFAIVIKINNAPVIKGYRNLDELARRMARFTFHVDRSVLQLPEAIHTDVVVTLGAAEMMAYRQFEVCACAEIASGVVTASNALTKLLRLQQLTSGFLTVPSDFDGSATPERLGSAKEDALADFLCDLERGERVVVFARFVEDLRSVERACDRSDPSRQYFEISGSRKNQDIWSGPGRDGAVLGVQVQAGSEAIDLTAARYCYFFSTGWSLGEHEQCLARVHRPGQTRAVFYYHSIASGTVDEDVRLSIAGKRDIIQGVVRGIVRRQAALDAPPAEWQNSAEHPQVR